MQYDKTLLQSAAGFFANPLKTTAIRYALILCTTDPASGNIPCAT